MSVTPEAATPPTTIAGYSFALRDRTGGNGGLLNLQIALHGAPLVALARALATLDGVRVTRGPAGVGPERCYLVHCSGFKMVLSLTDDAHADFALALVSRTPQATLALMSELGSLLERLMSAPPPVAAEPPAVASPPSALRRTALVQGKPLARKTALRRKTPLARSRIRP